MLISQLDCPGVRAALDVSYTEEMIPDDIILLDVFAGSASREVEGRDPLIATRTPDELARLRTATMFYTAASMVLSLPQIISENIGGYHYQAKSVDPLIKIADLRGRGDMEIASVLTPDSNTPLRPTMFTLASGRRGY